MYSSLINETELPWTGKKRQSDKAAIILSGTCISQIQQHFIEKDTIRAKCYPFGKYSQWPKIQKSVAYQGL